MNTSNKSLKLSAVALAVAASVVSLSARADEEEAKALKTPVNTVELGVSNTSNGSYKFGEYNGLEKKGADLVGNVNIRGGDAYSNNENGGLTRWSLIGNDLGLTDRTVLGTYGQQGKWNIGAGFDQLQHNTSDSYNTPFQGAMGGNTFVLPSNFGLAPSTQALTKAQLGAYNGMDIYNTRKNSSFNAGMAIDSRWTVSFDYNHLDQSGAKLQTFGSAKIYGATNELVSMLPAPTNYKTDTFNLALNWVGEKGYMTTSYYGSMFRDGYDRLTYETWGGANVMQNIPTVPGNDFHQVNFTGGYNIAPKTKVVTNLSYGRNFQNNAFVVDPAMMLTAMPVTSLGGQIINTHADVKVTDQSVKNLVLSASAKFDERNNQTPSNTYNFAAIDGTATKYPNTPISYDKAQYQLAGDYRVKQDHHLNLSLEHDTVGRWCNNYAVSAGYPAGTVCVVDTGNHEDKLNALYRLKANESLDFKLGLGYANRKSYVDPYAIASFAEATATKNPGFVPGQNAGDYLGFQPFFEASRKETSVKGNVNWKATDKFSLMLGGKFTGDTYPDSVYGVQNGNSYSLNADATYAYSESGVLSAFVTQQHRQRNMTSQQRVSNSASAASATAIAIPAGATWSNKMTDDDVTVGLGIKQMGLMKGKIDITGDLTYTSSRTNYSTTLNYNTTTTGGQSCSDPSIESCGSLPSITSSMAQLKLTGTYHIDKKSDVVLRVVYQHLASNDYFYNGYQMGYSPTGFMPTNQQAPNYNISAVALSYLYKF